MNVEQTKQYLEQNNLLAPLYKHIFRQSMHYDLTTPIIHSEIWSMCYDFCRTHKIVKPLIETDLTYFVESDMFSSLVKNS